MKTLVDDTPFPISITLSHARDPEATLNHAHTENAGDDGRVNDGSWNACPLVVSELNPVLPVCVNKAALQHVPPDQGPALCTVGAVVEAVRLPRGLGALSAVILTGSNE